MTSELITINHEKWSGDHCGATEIIPGVVFANRPIKHPDPHLYDLAPTILSEFGITAPEEMIGKNIFDSDSQNWKPERALPYL